MQQIRPRIAGVMARQYVALTTPNAPPAVRSLSSMLAPDLACSVDGSMPAESVPARKVPAKQGEAGVLRLHVTTHSKRFGMTEIRFIHDQAKGPVRVGKLTVPRLQWLAVYRRMLLWACGEGLVSLSLDEHAAPY